MPFMVTVVVPVGLVVFIFFVVHAAFGALAGLVAATAFAMHRADVGGSIFLALFGFGRFRVMIAAARNGDCRSSSEKHQKYHDF